MKAWEWPIALFALIGSVLSTMKTAALALVFAVALLAAQFGATWLHIINHQDIAAGVLSLVAFLPLWWCCVTVVSDRRDIDEGQWVMRLTLGFVLAIAFVGAQFTAVWLHVVYHQSIAAGALALGALGVLWWCCGLCVTGFFDVDSN